MLYVKKNLEGCEITIPIHCDNVYGICQGCGAETSVDINGMIEGSLAAATIDVENFEVICEKCTAKN